MTRYLIQGWFPKYENFGKHCERLAVFPPDLTEGPTVEYDACRFMQDGGYPLYTESNNRGCILFNEKLEVDVLQDGEAYLALRCPSCLEDGP